MVKSAKSGMVYVVMGGQYGSEGKGEFVAYLARKLHQQGTLGAVVRTGGPNAGHTMTVNGTCPPDDPAIGLSPCTDCLTSGYHSETYKMRQIPCAWHLNPTVPLFIGPGSLIDPEVLERELSEHPDVRLGIDPSAVIITEEDRNYEREGLDLRSRIGSTTEGIGAARARHALRLATIADPPGPVNSNHDFIRHRISLFTVAHELDYILESGYDVLVESTQGFGLSLNHSGCYPYTTSRDLTPAQILNDAGISSRREHRVITVLRTFPIRVAGNSGPLPNEVTWEEMARTTNGQAKPERTTVTNLVRRIGAYDSQMVREMALHCRPDALVLTFADYLDPYLHGCTDYQEVQRSLGDSFLSLVRRDAKAPIYWFGTGPGIFAEVIDPASESPVQLGMDPGITQESATVQRLRRIRHERRYRTS